MLYIINQIDDPLIEYIKDDPVRPEIPAEWRVTDNKKIFTIVDTDNKPQAIVCVAFCDNVPTRVEDLFTESKLPTNAIFYTIWSYSAGAGRSLIQQAQKYISETFTDVKRFVTLSPPTEMARKFHLRNGAVVFRENETTVNYEYL